MVKRMVVWSVIGVLAIASAFYFLFYRITGPGGNPLDAVPASAAVVFEWQNPRQEVPAIMQDSLWRVLHHYGLVQQLSTHFTELDTFYKTNWATGPLVMIVQRTGAGTFGTCAITESAAKPEAAAIRDMGYVSRQYKNATIWEGNGIALCWHRGLLIHSAEPTLVELALATLRGDAESPGGSAFGAIRDAASKNNRPKMYINFDALPQLLAVALAPEGIQLAEQMSTFAAWAVVEYAVSPEGLFLTGTTATSPQRNGHLSKLMELPPGGKDITEVLPYNTAIYYAIKSAGNDLLLRDMDASIRGLYDDYFINWAGARAAIAIVEPYSGEYETDMVLVVEAADPEQALVSLGQLASRGGGVPAVENFKGFPIFRLSGLKGLEQVAGFRSAYINDPYVTLIDEMVVCAPTLAHLKILLDRYLDQQTLSKDLDYRAFRKNMTDDPAVNIYINTARCMPVLKRMAGPGFGQFLESSPTTFQALNPIGVQFNPLRRNTWLLTGLVQAGQSFQAATNLLWKADLDTLMGTMPVLVTNHNDNSRELLVQDLSSNLYLVDRAGKVVWKRNLDAAIVGEIYQVDYYRNGKYQWLFSTEGAIYLVDRLGRDVENFPLNLPATNTSGLAMFDYDRNGDFRMFVGCNNGNIYGWQKSGRPLTGWSPKRNAGILTHPMFHFTAGPRDYIVALTVEGVLTAFARDGQVRIGPVHLNAGFNQPFAVESTEGRRFRLANADTRGRLVRVDENGQVTRDSLFHAIGDVRYLHTDLDGDGNPDHIFMDKYRVIAFGKENKQIMEYQIPGETVSAMFPVQLANEKLIGLVDEENERIYLVRSNGSVYPDFPLRGRSPFLLTSALRSGETLIVTSHSDHTLATFRLK